MTPRPPTRNREQGVALVTTVIVVAVLAVVAVAMMQSTTVDRLSARSVANYTRARLAADAGLAMASAAIATNLTNDTFIVVLNPTNRQLFVGNGVAGGTNFSYAPLFSVVSGVTNAVTKVVTNGIPTFSPSGLTTNFPSWPVPGGLSVSSPPAISWTYLTTTNTAGQVVTNARFAYWVEDLGGRLDLSVVGTNSTAVGRRPTGTNPAEIALWSLFNPGASNDVANAAAGALTSARSNILSAATARLVDSSVTTNMLADLAANLRHDTNEPEVIPFGFGYADEGKAKYNLNTNLIAAGVGVLADAINRNLPQFGTRGGAMSPADYVNNIAASIADYADADSVPTVDSADPPAWRGVEAIPWPNEVFTRFHVTNRISRATEWEFEVNVKQYLEVWNLSSKPVALAANAMTISNNLDIPLQCVSWNGNLKSADPGDPPRFDPITNAITLAPNSYAIVAAGTRLHNIRVPKALTGTNSNPPLTILPSTAANKYTIALDGKTIDATPGGRWLGASTNLRIGDIRYVCTASAFGTSAGGSVYNLAGGDPRAQLFIRQPSMAIAYTVSTPGGRNRYSPATGAANTVDPNANWPDRGHVTNSDVAASPATPGASISSVANLAGNTNHYVQWMNDSGAYSNVFELGNVFDPIQWGDPDNPFFPRDSAAWMNLTKASSITNFDGAGGRNSLRVGRPEHGRFVGDGQRAVQLLDLFAAGTNVSGPVTSRVPGRINLNTAGTNALRALAAGVHMASDPALKNGGTNFVVPTNAVNAFINAVTNARTQRPFSSTVQLATVTTNGNIAQWPTNAIFGNFGPGAPNATNYYGNSSLGLVTEWNDRAAEEWFAKVCPLATVRSRNFLVHVVGQSLQTNGVTVLSTAKKTFQIYMEPMRPTSGSSAGLTTNSVPRTLATWDL